MHMDTCLIGNFYVIVSSLKILVLARTYNACTHTSGLQIIGMTIKMCKVIPTWLLWGQGCLISGHSLFSIYIYVHTLLTAICFCWSDGIKLQSCTSSAKNQRHDPWMGKGSKEEEKAPTWYGWVDNPHGDEYRVLHRRGWAGVTRGSLRPFIYPDRVAALFDHHYYQYW